MMLFRFSNYVGFLGYVSTFPPVIEALRSSRLRWWLKIYSLFEVLKPVLLEIYYSMRQIG